MTNGTSRRPSLAFRAAPFVVLGACVALPAACYAALRNATYDSGEIWGIGEWLALRGELQAFQRVYLADSPDEPRWEAAIEVVDPSRAEREMGVTPLPPLFLPLLPDFRLDLDEASKLAALYAPRGSRVLLLGDRQVAEFWDVATVRDVRRARGSLAWTLDDPRVEWDPIDRENP